MKTLKSIKSAKYKKNKVKFSNDNKSKLDGGNKLNSKDEVSDNEIGNNEVDNNKVLEKKNSWKISKSKKMISFLGFFIFKIKLMFIKLREVFVKASVFYHFYLDNHL